jgi:hypothetical protein
MLKEVIFGEVRTMGVSESTNNGGEVMRDEQYLGKVIRGELLKIEADLFGYTEVADGCVRLIATKVVWADGRELEIKGEIAKIEGGIVKSIFQKYPGYTRTFEIREKPDRVTGKRIHLLMGGSAAFLSNVKVSKDGEIVFKDEASWQEHNELVYNVTKSRDEYLEEWRRVFNGR